MWTRRVLPWLTGAGAAAIDVWAAGMILLFFLTKKFPLFQSNDDTEALMEIAMVVGRRKMEKTATLHSTCSPRLASRIQSIDRLPQAASSRRTSRRSCKRAFLGQNSSNAKTPMSDYRTRGTRTTIRTTYRNTAPPALVRRPPRPRPPALRQPAVQVRRRHRNSTATRPRSTPRSTSLRG